jgi:hypothetical protein
MGGEQEMKNFGQELADDVTLINALSECPESLPVEKTIRPR